MKSYIIKPRSVRKREIENKFYSFLPSEHRKVEIHNKKQNTIQNLVDFEEVGSQIDVQEYLTFDSKHYLGTISCMNGLLYDETRGEKISPNIYKKSAKKLKKGDVVISRNASLGKIAFVNNDSKVILNGGLSFLRFQQQYKNYATAFFIVEFGAEYLTCLTSGGGTQKNAKRQNLLDVPIPFPTTKNHKTPEKVENLVSLIVQNIIDKEEQIKLKDKQIDELIKKELKENQKAGSFNYSYPRISEIKEETRLDTGLYEKEFKKIDFLIRNYKGGFEETGRYKIKTGRTPKDYYYTKYIPNKTYFWLTPKYIKKNIFTSKQYLFTKQETNLQDEDLIFTGIGTGSQGHMLFYDKKTLGKVYINQNAYAISMDKESKIKKLFTLCFLSSYFFKNTIQNFTSKGSVPAIYPRDIAKLKIPNFLESKQQEIAELYYNPLGKNKDLNLENYLKKEQTRNREVGIFQLNMEIFTLREQLEDLVHKIVIEEKIELKFEYQNKEF